jgi:beta-phosphoglucomutase-like phosphatase (HAD superfamily)
MEIKKGIIFDMDGVLVDAMPFHCKAIQTAAKQEVNIDVAQRDCPGKTWSGSCLDIKDTPVI